MSKTEIKDSNHRAFSNATMKYISKCCILVMLLAINPTFSFRFTSRIIHTSTIRKTFLRFYSNESNHSRLLEKYSRNYHSDISSLFSATKSNNDLSSNDSIVKSRLSTQMGKRKTRKQNLEEDRQRNLRLKKLMDKDGTSDGSSFSPPELYAVRVSVDKVLRDELHLNGREKRGRVFIEIGSDGSQTLKGLKQEIHSFFRCLKRSSFLISAALPEVSLDGSIISPSSENMETSTFLKTNSFWSIESDEDVINTFDRVSSHYNSCTMKDQLKRPSVLIHIYKNPNAPPPPPPPLYLQNMADPKLTESMTMLSFYSFPIPSIQDPEEFGEMLRKVWKPFGALGRVYVAKEGVNAQMAVPTNVMSNFMECCKSIHELGEFMENGINIDPISLTMEEFNSAGVSGEDETPSPPFKALHVRVRSQIVADGLSSSLDWEKAGYDMPPLEWHNIIKDTKDGNMKEEDKPLLLDCRNSYETGVGRFDLAEPLNTETFRETWDVLEERLKDVPKDAPIMTYCTGGIRCVKVGAYLTQKMNFTNVSRLAGGIIAYDRTINTEDQTDESLFKGTNYVFDGRVGRAITNDALGTCITCGVKTNLVTNCRNTNCHKRMVQCENCQEKYLGTCSDACKQRVINSKKNENLNDLTMTTSDISTKTLDTVEDYSEFYSSFDVPFLDEIQKNTQHYFPTGAHMVSGSTQGQFLKMLSSMTKYGRILEVGTFTGYATACFWEGIRNKKDNSFLLTLERDKRAIEIAKEHLSIMEKHGMTSESASMAKVLRESDAHFHDEIKDGETTIFQHKNMECQLMHVTDGLATIEEIASKSERFKDLKPFDLIFIDADKTRLLEYVEASLSLLNQGGIIVVDNVLWKGLVLEAAGTKKKNQDKINLDENTDMNVDEEENKRSRRKRRLAGIMHRFNEAIASDDRVEVMMLPIRDGLSIIRKK